MTLVRLLAVVLLGCATVSSAQTAQSTPLEPGKPIERELAGAGAHSYSFSMTTGQFLYLVAEQKGIDVVVTLFAPDGRKLAEVDSPNGSTGREPLAFVTDASGTYRLEVRSLEKDAAAGRYAVRIDVLRAATAQDRQWVLAHNAFAEAELLRAQGTAASMRGAIAKYEESVRHYQAAEDRATEASALNNIGAVHYQLGETQQSIDHFDRARAIQLAIGDRAAAGRTLANIGIIHTRLGQAQKAQDASEEALSLVREAGDRGSEASILNNLGNLSVNQSEFRKALDYFNQSLAASKAARNHFGEAATIGNIGGVYNALGEKAKALEFHQQALATFRAMGLRANEGATLNNIGLVYFDLGLKQKALDYYYQGLPISRAVGDRAAEANALGNIGRVYSDLGEKQTSLDYYNQALALYRAVRNRVDEAVALNNIGLAYSDLGEKQKALDYYSQALPIAQAVGNRVSEARTLTNMGSAYLDLGERQKALEFYEQALPLRRAAGDRRGEAITLNNIGLAYYDLGENQRAAGYYTQALSLSRAVGDRKGEAGTLYLAARVDRDLGHLDAARAQIEQCLTIVEELRTDLTTQDLRASYLSTAQKYYRFHVELLMDLHRQHASGGFDAAALQASERARARSLLELLTEAGADIRRGIDSSLLERERALQQLLRGKTERQITLLNGRHTPEQAADSLKELEALKADYRQVEAQIRKASPRYAALTQPQPLGAEQIQQLLDKDTLLLEYALGEQRSYLWVVSRTAIRSFELPKREEIEATAKRFYASLTAPNQQPRNAASDDKRGLQAGSADGRQSAEAAAALGKILLAPVASQLGKQRLVIVADGALMYVPFAALSVPAAEYRPLIVDHEVVNLPSASSLAVLRQETSGRKMAPKTVAVLADPVFGADDDRVAPMANRKPGDTEAGRSIEETRLVRAGLSLNRLPGTRQEAERIAAFVPGASVKLLDFDANRAAAHGTNLSEYRYVHFATHGFLNSVNPDLSGLVLSTVDREGRPQNGFLLADEVFNLHLPAEMVVLSACQTGLGKEVKGEGLVGLTRGFMYAGAPRVVVSLWNVNDQATSELMVRFYRGVLKERRSPAAALRAAQIEMWKQQRWRTPYYWASFVLQGEWR